ncbi:heavy metal-binding protein HIP-like [Mya arenaria]|uniref:heavy metal-binding protein HIP-like n=1 Tax=Mya arenaria TaxID=6604 RepID=UPI0022E6D423|nr:heavy metal-binding protein HIP-like [Mya arenaria]
MWTRVFLVLLLGVLHHILTINGAEITGDVLRQIKDELRYELQEEMTKMKRDIESLKERNSVLELKLLLCCGKEDSITSVQQEENTTDKDHNDHENSKESEPTAIEVEAVGMERITRGINRRVAASAVAFSAYLSQHAQNLGEHQIVPFDRTEINIGAAFDTLLHVFTCPVNGVYYFQSTVLCVYLNVAVVETVKDGSSLCVSLAHGAVEVLSGGGDDQGSNAIITNCNRGQRVWVRVYDHWADKIHDGGGGYEQGTKAVITSWNKG